MLVFLDTGLKLVLNRLKLFLNSIKVAFFSFIPHDLNVYICDYMLVISSYLVFLLIDIYRFSTI